jgi:hypothetical protein
MRNASGPNRPFASGSPPQGGPVRFLETLPVPTARKIQAPVGGLTATEAQRRLGCTYVRLQRYAAVGRIRINAQPGDRVLYDPAFVDALAAELRRSAAPAAAKTEAETCLA